MPHEATSAARVPEVAGAFLRLGLTSFGGPTAHIGFFRDEFVRRRHWVDDTGFAHLLALCQILPGPTSSQLGFALGWMRAGAAGAIAAFLAFTAPSVLLMLALVPGVALLGDAATAMLLHALKLLAVCVVARACFDMARALPGPRRRWWLALAAAAAMLLVPVAWMQPLLIAAGALAGAMLLRDATATQAAVPTMALPAWMVRSAVALLLLLLAASLWIAAQPASLLALLGAFYRAGALSFGGGHVVLPLLDRVLVDGGWISAETFLAGYGAAQAVPGPMFSLVAFLGAEAMPQHPVAAGLCSVLAIFLPGFLLLAIALPGWSGLLQRRGAAAAIAGANAAAVGLLFAAFVDPVLLTAIAAPVDIVVIGIGLAVLVLTRSTLLLLLFCMAAAAMTAAGY